jgi:chromosome segregation ATPase
MARPGVTYLDVSNAAQQLTAAGRSPTIETVRIALGTGSNSTLGMHLKTWKLKQDQTQQIATKENIPEELVSALKGIWERVMNQSEDRIQSIQQETQQELTRFNQEVQRLQKDNSHWQQQYQQTKQERDSFAHEKSAVEQLLANVRIEAATLSERLTGSEKYNQEKQARIDELHRQNQQIQANLEHYRNATLEQRLADQQRYGQQQKQLEHTFSQVNQQVTQLQRENTKLQQQYQQVHFERDNLKLQLDKLHLQHEAITMNHADLFNELTKKTQDQQHWQTQHYALQTKSDEQNKSFIELQAQLAVSSQQLLKLEAALREMSEQNKALANEKWILGQEKANLYGQLKQLESCI